MQLTDSSGSTAAPQNPEPLGDVADVEVERMEVPLAR